MFKLWIKSVFVPFKYTFYLILLNYLLSLYKSNKICVWSAENLLFFFAVKPLVGFKLFWIMLPIPSRERKITPHFLYMLLFHLNKNWKCRINFHPPPHPPFPHIPLETSRGVAASFKNILKPRRSLHLIHYFW